MCDNNPTDSFSIAPGDMRGGRPIHSQFLFILAIDWLMTEITTISIEIGDIHCRWSLMSVLERLEDLDYAYDIGLLSSRPNDMK